MLNRVVGGVVVVALALAGGASAAGPAAAAPSPGAVRESAFPSPRMLILRGTHGYEIGVTADPPARGRSAQVSVSVEDSRNRFRYTAPAKLVGEGIHASFGVFGRIDLRWVPDQRVASVSFACHDHGPIRHYFFRRGAYVGTFDFRGGDGFTTAHAHRVDWRRSWYRGDSTCRREGGESNPGSGAILGAGTGGREPRTTFFLYQPRPGARVFYSASDRERVGSLTIERSIEARGAPATLAHPPDLSAATVSPPAPFSGTAAFAATEELGADEGATGTWLGDLAVDFPDGSHAALAGVAFEANLRSGRLEGLARP